MPENHSITRSPVKIIILYILITIFILIAGIRYYIKQQNEIRSDIHSDLSAISELKVNQIFSWRKERIGDASTIFENENFAGDVKNWFGNPERAEYKNRIIPLLTTFAKNYHYKNLILLDKELNIKFILANNIKHIGEKTKSFVKTAISDSVPELSNIYECELCKDIHLDIFVPLKIKSETIGLLIIRIDPEDFLFPLIQSWPTKSNSAENVLVSVDNGHIVYLNELRHRKNTTLKLKFKIDSTNINIPSVMAALGKEGMFEGLDYRGVPVLSDIRKIPNSPWFLIAKVDIEEIYSPVKEKALTISLLTGLVLLAVGIGFIWVWSNQKKSLRILQLEEDYHRQALIKHFEYIVKNANDILILLDEKMNIVEANERALNVLGYTKEELLKLNASEFRPEGKDEELAGYLKRLKENGEVFFESSIKTKNGAEIPIENNAHTIEIGGRQYYQTIFRDITERKKAEKELKASEKQYRSLFENMQEGFAYCEMIFEDNIPVDFKYIKVNDAFYALTGLKDVEGKMVTEVIPGIRISDDKLFEIYGKVAKTGATDRFEIFVDALNDWYDISVYCPKIGFFVAVFDVITQRKEIEKKLKESELKFRSLFENSILGIYRTTPEGKIVDCNPALLKLLGYEDFEELSKRNLENYGYEPGYSRNDFKDQINLKGEVIGLESSWIKKDGTAIVVRENSKAIKDESGEIILYEGTVEDITEKKKIEMELKQSEQKYRRLHESMMDGFALVNMQGMILECNESYKEMLGYSFEELVKLSYVDLTPEKWHEYESTIVRDQIKEKGYSEVYEKEYIRKNGEVFPVELRTFLLKNNAGENEGMWGIVRDITERKKADEKIINSEKKFSSIFHSSPYAIVLTAPENGEIIEVNKSFESVFGYTISETKGKTTIDLNLWINDDERKAMIAEIEKTGKCINNEIRFRKKSGEIRNSLFNAEFVSIDNRKLILASIADITELKKAEEKIRDLVKRYHLILSKQYYGTLVVSEENVVEFVNEKFIELFGLKERAEELIGIKGELLISKIIGSYKDPEYVLGMIKRFVENGNPEYDFEVELINGTVLLVDYNPIVIGGVNSGRIWQHRDITDRKKMENDLRKSYDLLESMGVVGKIGGWEFDTKTLKGTWTKQVALIHELDPDEETNAEKGMSFYIGESRKKIEKAIKEAIENGTSYDLELEMKTAKGNHKWVRTIGETEKKDGKVIRVYGSFQDVTDLKKIEKAFKESQKEKFLLAELIENSSQPIGVGYADGRLGIFNNALISLTGYSREELARIDWAKDLTPPEWYDIEILKLKELHESNKPVRYEKEYIKKDGARVPIELFVHLVRDESGNPDYYYSFITDITERKNAIEKLTESENKFRTLFESMNEGVALHELVFDEKGDAIDYRIIDVNPTFEKHTGLSAEKAKNRIASEFYGIKTLPPYFDIYKNVALTGIPDNFESYFEPLDKYFEVSVFSPAKNKFATIFTDFTERKRIEKNLKESEEKYRLLAENAMDVIWILDIESGNFRYVSPSVEHLRGYSVEEVLEQGIEKAITAESMNYLSKIIPERIEKFKKGIVEFYVDEIYQPHKDGHIVETEVTSRYLTNQSTGKIEVLGVSRDITERKKAGEKIKKISSHYRALIEKATDGIVLLNNQGHFKYISPTAKKIFGYNPDEVIEGNPSEYTHPDDLPMVLSHLTKLLEDENYIPTLQYRFQNKKKEWQWVESIFSNLLSDPNVESIVLNFRDITERKIAEDKILKISRINSFISHINQAIVHINNVDEIYKESCRIAVDFGKFRMAWIGIPDSLSNYIKPVALAGYEEGYLSTFNIRSVTSDSGKSVYHGPSGIALLNGKSYFCNDIENDPVMSNWKVEALKRGYRSSIAVPIKKSGKIIGTFNLYSDSKFFFDKEEVSLLEDVTNDIGFAVDAIEIREERRKIIGKLRENEKRLREAQDLAHLGYWRWDINSGQVEWSDEVFSIFRLDKKTFIPQIDSILALSPWPEENQRDKELINRAIESHNPGFYEQKFLRPDNSIGYYSSTFQGNYNEKNELVSIVGTIMDITERKLNEIEVQKLNQELEQRVKDRTIELQNSNKELEAFSYSVSHDLRAPLRSIDGFSLALMEDYYQKLDSTAKDYINRIRNATSKMDALIDSMLKLSRVTRFELKKEKINLSKIAKDITQNLKAANQVRESEFIIKDNVFVEADNYLITIAMENLLGNAWKYTSKKEKTVIEFGLIEKDMEVIYFIKDNGAGFDMKYIGKLFGAFQRLHSAKEYPGTGIGLATTQRIIRRHGGEIWADSIENKETTFYFTLK